MIKRLSHTDVNYIIAVTALQDRYADPVKQTEVQWPCGVVVACLLHTQEVPGSIPGRGSYLRQVSLH